MTNATMVRCGHCGKTKPGSGGGHGKSPLRQLPPTAALDRRRGRRRLRRDRRERCSSRARGPLGALVRTLPDGQPNARATRRAAGRVTRSRAHECPDRAGPDLGANPGPPRGGRSQSWGPRTVHVSTTTVRVNIIHDSPAIDAEGVGAMAGLANRTSSPADGSVRRKPAWSSSPAAVTREAATAGC